VLSEFISTSDLAHDPVTALHWFQSWWHIWVFIRAYIRRVSANSETKCQSVLLSRWSIIPFAINSGPGMDSSYRKSRCLDVRCSPDNQFCVRNTPGTAERRSIAHSAVVNTNAVFTELWQCYLKSVQQNLTLLEHLAFKVTTTLGANHLLNLVTYFLSRGTIMHTGSVAISSGILSFSLAKFDMTGPRTSLSK